MKNKKACFYLILATLSFGSVALLASASSTLPDYEDEQHPSSPSPLRQSLNAPSTPPDNLSSEISEQAHTLIKQEHVSPEDTDKEASERDKANQRALAVLSATKNITNIIKQKQDNRTKTAQKLSEGSIITDIKQEDGSTTHVISASAKSTEDAITMYSLDSLVGTMIQVFVENSKGFFPKALLSLQESYGTIQSSIDQLEAARPHVAEHNLKAFDAGVERLERRVKIIEALQCKTHALILILNPASEGSQPLTLATLNYMHAEALQNTEVQTIFNDIHHLTDELLKI